MMDLQKNMMAQQQQQVQQLAETNEQAGKAFLAENRQKEGVKTTMSGLQYKVISKGTGKKPGPNDKVTVHYRGRLLDGTEFDSSYKRDKPATFPVGGVIPGWTEGLQLMKEGAKWQLFIPAKLAYGEKSAGPMIGPNATLIFDVELVSVN
jgi:FKBP-type peptidyl-prolyl cis-trans isomerase FklB